MKVSRRYAEYAELRKSPVWSLLAADKAPIVISLLESHFPQGERVPESVAVSGLQEDLNELSMEGLILEKIAKAYLLEWVQKGYLERTLYTGDAEECYEISTQAERAIRFLSTVLKPPNAVTESRLSIVLQLAKGLADDTNPDPEAKLASLREERDAIDRRITEISKSGFIAIEPERAVERTKELISLTVELTGDFSRVRSDFERLNRELRQNLAECDGHRGKVLGQLFDGIDLIASSDSGRSFNGFWKMLMDRKRRTLFDEYIESIQTREFYEKLTVEEREYLRDIPDILFTQGENVHEIQRRLARSLSEFVTSREYIEHRRINRLLREAGTTALKASEKAGVRADMMQLDRSSCKIRTVGQWVLRDVSYAYVKKDIKQGKLLEKDLADVAREVGESEIDYRTLKERIRDFLADREQASISELLDRYGAEQGLATILGYLDVAWKCGIRTESTETVSWRGSDGMYRSAAIPRIFFIKERLDDL